MLWHSLSSPSHYQTTSISRFGKTRIDATQWFVDNLPTILFIDLNLTAQPGKIYHYQT
ncbi:hypothetical protein [Trichocoleus desertorum]|uniref:hypothetical protein n=1 Tax=Trichocoleus desertorum TaxID=1481672 RepID=UPI00329A33E0